MTSPTDGPAAPLQPQPQPAGPSVPPAMPPVIPPLGRRSPAPEVIAPDGSEIRRLLDGRHQAAGASMVEVVLPAGQVSRPVYHRTVEELWYILEGRGQVWRCPPDADTDAAADANTDAAAGPAPGGAHSGEFAPGFAPHPVQPGDALTIPTGWRFQFSADRDASVPLRFLCITLPPWPGPAEAQPADYGGLGAATV